MNCVKTNASTGSLVTINAGSTQDDSVSASHHFFYLANPSYPHPPRCGEFLWIDIITQAYTNPSTFGIEDRCSLFVVFA
jgi:hypothetical protein